MTLLGISLLVHSWFKAMASRHQNFEVALGIYAIIFAAIGSVSPHSTEGNRKDHLD